MFVLCQILINCFLLMSKLIVSYRLIFFYFYSRLDSFINENKMAGYSNPYTNQNTVSHAQKKNIYLKNVYIKEIQQYFEFKCGGQSVQNNFVQTINENTQDRMVLTCGDNFSNTQIENTQLEHTTVETRLLFRHLKHIEQQLIVRKLIKSIKKI